MPSKQRVIGSNPIAITINAATERHFLCSEMSEGIGPPNI